MFFGHDRNRRNKLLRSRLNLKTGPAQEPVTLSEAKAHLRVTNTSEDTLITNLIVSARQSAEIYTDRVFITQTWQQFFDSLSSRQSIPWWDGTREGAVNFFTPNSLEMPKAPLKSVVLIQSFDDLDVATIFADTNYQVSSYTGINPPRGRITLRTGAAWPFGTRNADGLEIEFVAGYGVAADVPQQIKQAILEEVTFRYENRGDCVEGSVNSTVAQGMLRQFKMKML